MQDQLQQALLQQLRDVHLPEQVGWWPLATAWWVLAAFIMTTIIAGIIYLRRHRKKNQYRKAAQIDLQCYFEKWQTNGDSASYLQGANLTLKRCFRHFSIDQLPTGSSSLTLTGPAWITHLNLYARQNFSVKTEVALGTDCYQEKPSVAVEQVNTEVSRWIKSHRHKPVRSAAERTSNTEVEHA